MLHKQSFYCLSKITSIILWIQLVSVQFSRYPVLLEIQYKIMFRHKAMWSRGSHRPVAWNKVCGGVNNNHLDRRVAAHSFPAHTIQRWELKLPFNFMTGCQVSQTEKLDFLFFLFFPFLLHKNTSQALRRIIFKVFDLSSCCVLVQCVFRCIFKSHFLFFLCSLQRSFH